MSDPERTIWCGGLSSDASEEILYELFLQAGPLERVTRPKDARTGDLRSFAFIVYDHDVSVPYAIELFEGTELFGVPLRLQAQGSDATSNNKNGRQSSAQQRQGADDRWGRGRVDERPYQQDRRSNHHHQQQLRQTVSQGDLFMAQVAAAQQMLRGPNHYHQPPPGNYNQMNRFDQYNQMGYQQQQLQQTGSHRHGHRNTPYSGHRRW